MRAQITLAIWASLALTGLAKPPNIVVIVADDLGYNDISWHNSDIISPNLETLAREGIILENAYVQPICTPTRSALMTGYYPIHTGRQTMGIHPAMPVGLFTNLTLLPEHLTNLGFRTHAIGKWHLGFCNEAYLPTQRGFDSFHGFWLGSQSYYKHTREAGKGGGPPGYDFRHNEDVDLVANGTYSSFLFANYSRDLIAEHSANHGDKPFFLYLAFQDTHGPLQVPKEYEDLYPHIHNKNRRIFSGMVTALDDAVGRVVDSLKEHGMYDNTIIVFTSDNGGQTFDGGNNYPLRGNKDTIWEGGTRATAFLHAPFLKHQKGIIHNGLIHVTDWLPTLVSAAGGDPSSLGNIDGIDQWDSLANGRPTPRKEMLYNYNPTIGHQNELATEGEGGAIRVGDMKLIVGDAGVPDGWIKPEDVSGIDDQDDLDRIFRILLGKKAEEGVYSQCLEEYRGVWNKVRLYNLTADPTEHFDISHEYPETVVAMRARLYELYQTMIPPNWKPESKKGNPNNFGGYFSTGWCKEEPRNEEENADVLVEMT